MSDRQPWRFRFQTSFLQSYTALVSIQTHELEYWCYGLVIYYYYTLWALVTVMSVTGPGTWSLGPGELHYWGQVMFSLARVFLLRGLTVIQHHDCVMTWCWVSYRMWQNKNNWKYGAEIQQVVDVSHLASSWIGLEIDKSVIVFSLYVNKLVPYEINV